MSSNTIDHKMVADRRRRKQLGSSNIAILLGVLNKTVTIVIARAVIGQFKFIIAAP